MAEIGEDLLDLQARAIRSHANALELFVLKEQFIGFNVNELVNDCQRARLINRNAIGLFNADPVGQKDKVLFLLS